MPSRFAPPATPCCRTSRFSPLPEAPTFQSVANTPGMTELALTVWLQSSHPTMPNIILKQDDLRNVVAYIRSLESKTEEDVMARNTLGLIAAPARPRLFPCPLARRS